MALFELDEKRAELLSFELVRHCLRDEAREAARTNPPSNGLGQVSRKADGKLRR